MLEREFMYFFTVVNPDTLDESRMTVSFVKNGIIVNDTKMSFQQAFEFGVMLTAMGLTEDGKQIFVQHKYWPDTTVTAFRQVVEVVAPIHRWQVVKEY
jgi:hypothetical protein